jgi:hypothetical protein
VHPYTHFVAKDELQNTSAKIHKKRKFSNAYALEE